MKKYRILKNQKHYKVQKKFLCFWIDVKMQYDPDGLMFTRTFQTIDQARDCVYDLLEGELEKTPYKVMEELP